MIHFLKTLMIVCRHLFYSGVCMQAVCMYSTRPLECFYSGVCMHEQGSGTQVLTAMSIGPLTQFASCINFTFDHSTTWHLNKGSSLIKSPPHKQRKKIKATAIARNQTMQKGIVRTCWIVLGNIVCSTPATLAWSIKLTSWKHIAVMPSFMQSRVHPCKDMCTALAPSQHLGGKQKDCMIASYNNNTSTGKLISYG